MRGKEPGREKRERNREDREYREKWNCRRSQRPTFVLPIPSLPFPSPSILSACECDCAARNGVVKERCVSLWIAFSEGNADVRFQKFLFARFAFLKTTWFCLAVKEITKVSCTALESENSINSTLF